jgi:hypothetical protein
MLQARVDPPRCSPPTIPLGTGQGEAQRATEIEAPPVVPEGAICGVKALADTEGYRSAHFSWHLTPSGTMKFHENYGDRLL